MAIGNNNHNKTSTKQLSNKSVVSVVNEAFFLTLQAVALSVPVFLCSHNIKVRLQVESQHI